MASFSCTRHLPVNYLHPRGVLSQTYCYCRLSRQLGTNHTNHTNICIDACVGDNDAARSFPIWYTYIYSSTNTLHSTLGKAINNEIHFFIQLFIIIFFFFRFCTLSQAHPYIDTNSSLANFHCAHAVIVHSLFSTFFYFR